MALEKRLQMDGCVVLSSAKRRAVILKHGAQIVDFRSHLPGARPLLWMGEKADFSPGSAIRGGIPLCWPWFGAPPEAGLPVNGKIRTAEWQLKCSGESTAEFALETEYRGEPFTLELSVSVTDALLMEFSCYARGTRPVSVECAMHAYWNVGNAERLILTGFEGCRGNDLVSGKEFIRQGPIRPHGESRMLFPSGNPRVELHDMTWERKICLESTSAAGWFLWNPGAERCAKIPDMWPEEYRRMFCVEACAARSGAWIMEPGARRSLSVRLTEEPWKTENEYQ